MDSSDLRGARVLVMGLGAHGGGAATARYCAAEGAQVTVTDLRSETDLRRSLDALSDLPLRYVLGTHELADFETADIVIKNPAVRRTTPLLSAARRIETDISLFLARHRGPVLAVTGTKGKSTTASALAHILRESDPRTRLGGNITVSPLSFARELSGDEPIVLELSSFQLGDLALTPTGRRGDFPSFAVSIVTNLFPDHQDYYGSMDAYAADKALIYAGQTAGSWCIAGETWPARLLEHAVPKMLFERRASDSANRPAAWIDERGGLIAVGRLDEPTRLFDEHSTLSGDHMRRDLLLASAAAFLFGEHPETIRTAASTFRGIPHRLELVATHHGVRYINDSAATIAQAARAAVDSIEGGVHLIAGGSDKGVPLDDFVTIARSVRSLHLLAGSATDRIVELLDGSHLPWRGPYASLREALAAARALAKAGETVLLSPGCASFGMFRNEFDRGDTFRSLAQEEP